jgi:hypothetical protein
MLRWLIGVLLVLWLPMATPVMAQDLEAGLAACAKLPPSGRERCEAAVRRAAPCWKLGADERRRCLSDAANAPAPRDPCAQAPDRARCEESLAAREACQGEKGSARAECLRQRESPRTSDCSRRRADERSACEAYNSAVDACRDGSIAEKHACVDAKYGQPMQLVRSGINPLDCRAPAGVHVAACALRDALLARCADAPADRNACTQRHAPFMLEDCASAPEGRRGQCAAHNAGFEFCLGKIGQDLRQCTGPHNGSDNYSRLCRSQGGPDFCADRDAAFARCTERKVAPAAFGQCVQSELSLSFRFQHWLLDREFVPR